MNRLVFPGIALICLVFVVLACQTGPSPTVIPVPSTPTHVPPPPTPIPTLAPTPLPRIDPREMVQILAGEEIPVWDRADRKVRIGILGRPVPRTVAGPPPSYAVGSVESFAFVDASTGQSRAVPAELRYVTEHAYFWFEAGAAVDQAALAQAAERFENEFYPTVRDYFGEEWSPGVDNDPHVSILHLFDSGQWFGLAGVNDQYTAEVWSNSNQREMFYVNLNNVVIGGDDYLAILAHEFQHLVQSNNDGNETHWLDEGLAQLAQHLVGFDNTVQSRFAFLKQSRTQLNTWVEPLADDSRHYGAAYLYALYLWERLGDGFIRALARHPAEGLTSVNATLIEQGFDLTADDLFADWIVANYLDDPTLGDGRYGYQSQTLAPICPRQRYAALPVQETRAVPQYGAEYFGIEGQGAFTVEFEGATEAALVPAEPHSGHSFWWSNRGDVSEMNLTRAFDLAGLERATLQFWTWYDIQQPAEEFACVAVSTDGGETWDFPNTGQATRGSYYPCYTGVSGDGSEPQWVLEEVDLSRYAGREILLRFEYMTDTWFNRPGFAVDDIAIPELGYTYDAETGDDGWVGAGFVRTSNAVPQTWAVWFITLGDEATVQRLDVAEDGTTRAEGSLEEGERVVLIVGAMAPATEEEAQYTLKISGELAEQAAPAEIGVGVLFQDGFDDVCSGWGTYSDGQGGSGYVESAYFIEIEAPGLSWWAMPGQRFADVTVAVDTTQEASAMDNTWGVLCRYQDQSNYYSFEIGGDGMYVIGAMVNGQYASLVDWTESDAINRGQGAANHLAVTCNGDLLRLAVNGQVLAEARDSALTSGDVGLVATTYAQGGSRILFDNLVVHQP